MIRKYLHLQNSKVDSTSQVNKFSFVASTSAVDRYGDIVQQNWELEAYKNNPVVLFNHDQHSLPIGKGDVRIENDQLLIDVEFDMGDEHAAEIARKANAGFLNAVSVGFQPLEYIPRADLPQDDDRYGNIGNLYTKSELLEVSIVTIPAQADAVAISKAGYLEFTDVLKSWHGKKAKTRFIANLRKHILRVEEAEDRFIVHFAKEESEPAEIEEVEEFLDDYIEASKDDEDEYSEETESVAPEDEDEEDEDDKKKQYNIALLRALTQTEGWL